MRVERGQYLMKVGQVVRITNWPADGGLARLVVIDSGDGYHGFELLSGGHRGHNLGGRLPPGRCGFWYAPPMAQQRVTVLSDEEATMEILAL